MPAIRLVSKYERTWIHHYEQLKKYKETHGNCNVPRKHEHLGQWVMNQRNKYRLLKEGKSSPMTDDRIRKLDSIGFQWISERALTKKVRHDLWYKRFQELKKYKETHGNCNVTERHGSLGEWVRTQRRNYRLLKEGKSSPMYDDRIHKLESIGFQWITERSLTNEERHDLWHKRFQELKKYKEAHGNCNVSKTSGSLGIWVITQRQRYRLLKEGKSSPMSDDRIHKLESIGFCWSCKRQHDNEETSMPTSIDAPPNSKSGHRYSLRSTSSTTAIAPDIVTSTVDFRDSRTDDEAAACDTLCDEDIDHSLKETRDGGPVFRPFLLGTGYC